MIRAQACSCGGRLRAAKADRVDLLPLFGLRGAVEGPVPVLRCDRCGAETYEPIAIDRMLIAVAREVLGQPRILGTEEARFVRKAILGLTQERLARRMGINSITIADWERGERAMSKEHDYELRGIALSSLLARTAVPLRAQVDRLAKESVRILTGPRQVGPLKRVRSYSIAGVEVEAA